jgi:deoxycytidylate deaminase
MKNERAKFTARDRKLFDIAREIASTSPHPKAKIGAVLVEGGSVISVHANGTKSHPLQQKYNEHWIGADEASSMRHLLHAEVGALVKGRGHFDPADAAIFVYRLMKG